MPDVSGMLLVVVVLALLFDFSNGWHDSANAVATVISTRVLTPLVAVLFADNVGDSITHDIVRKLNRTFITPIDREDIHALASALDDILDEIDEVADRFVIFKVPNSTPVAVRLAQILHEASVALNAGIEQLGKGQMDINDCSVRVNSLENEADRLSRDAISKLFDEEKDPIAVIKWKEIYENFEAGTDRCEDAANILERIVLKHI